jgi:hypothetical protein
LALRARQAPQRFGGVLAMAGSLDAEQRSVLLASHNDDEIIRMWELPNFADRGELSEARVCLSVEEAPDRLPDHLCRRATPAAVSLYKRVCLLLCRCATRAPSPSDPTARSSQATSAAL